MSQKTARGFVGMTLLEVATVRAIQQLVRLLILAQQMRREGVPLDVFGRQVAITQGEFLVLLDPVVGRFSHARQIGFHKSLFEFPLR